MAVVENTKTTKQASNASAKPPRRNHARPPLLPNIHRRHPVWGHIIRIFDWVWHGIWWVWGAIFVGGLFLNPAINFLTTGTIGQDPRTWYISSVILANLPLSLALFAALILLTILAGFAHSRAHGAVLPQRRGLLRVRDLDPDQYVPVYIEAVYLNRMDADGRDLDAAARATLTQTAQRPDLADSRATLGVCVYGRPTLGKTRLAWEAMRATLPNYRFIKWPYSSANAFDWESVGGEQIALWLDDLQEYANPSEGPTINDLPRRFAERGAHLVVIATCRSGEDTDRAKQYLSALLGRLEPLAPADITPTAADQLTIDLTQQGATVERAEFDGTPGSLLLGVERMRDQIYPALPTDAKRLLKTMKLLRSVYVYDYPAARLRNVGEHLFNLTPGAPTYRDAADALTRASFVRRAAVDETSLPIIASIADIYLEVAIPDFPPTGVPITTYWSDLQDALTTQRDASALVSLGSALGDLKIGLNPIAPYDLRSTLERSIACYKSALDIYTREVTPNYWAMIQNDLGTALGERAKIAEGIERISFLTLAEEAFRASLAIHQKDSFPNDWAMTQINLGQVLRHQAALTTGEHSIALLKQAESAHKAALDVYTQTYTPNIWLTLQHNLGNIFRDQVRFIDGKERLILLTQAEAAFRTVLANYSKEQNPGDWADTLNDLGVVLHDQADLVVNDEQAQLLEQAEEAFRMVLEVRSLDHTPHDWAMTQNNLGLTLFDRAALAEKDSRVRLLEQSSQALHETLKVFTRESSPSDWANTFNNLGMVIRSRASLFEGEQRTRLLEQSEHTYHLALGVYSKASTPLDWADVQDNLGITLCEQAKLTAGNPRTQLLTRAESAHRAALEVYTRENTPIDWAKAQFSLAQVLGFESDTSDEENAISLLREAVIYIRNAQSIFEKMNPLLFEAAKSLCAIFEQLLSDLYLRRFLGSLHTSKARKGKKRKRRT